MEGTKEAAIELISYGYSVLPCENKKPIDKIKSVNKLRVKPLHEANIDFYFSEPCDVAVLTGDTLEVIDVDVKCDLTGKLFSQLSSAIKYALPDVWDKLIIQKSPNSGFHLFYRCPQIGGNKTLAQRLATASEVAIGERIKTLIETRGEGGYIMVEPSDGYKFIKGSLSDVSFITPEDRAELIAICKSFNLLDTIELPGIGTKQRNNQDAPWNQFNAKNDWKYIKQRLTAAGWEMGEEDDTRVFVRRPGNTKSKSSGSIWKDRNLLYLFSTSTEFPDQKPLSPFDIVLYLQFDGDIQKCATFLSDQGYGTYRKEEGEFHVITEKGIKPKLSSILDWMSDIGVKKYFVSDTGFEVVHVIENRVKIIDLNYIKKVFCDYIHRSCSDEIYEFFLNKFTTIFTKEGLINLIEPLDGEFIKSTPDIGWLFFKNISIKVTAKEALFIEYSSIGGLIWNKNIIQREIKPLATNCEAKLFISKISNYNPIPFERCIGYLLHGFKDPSNPRVVILNDEFFEEDKEREPQGGTGKGMFIQLLSKFKNTVIIDGKTFSFNKSFLYQRVGLDTEIVAFEDVHKGFDFEKLFSIITDNWTIEKKGKDEFTIPFERSPKILATSNYPIKGSSASHLRRRHELEVHPYFSVEHTIKDEFGHLFFYDWDENEWGKFDNYMVDCLQCYLSAGMPEQVSVNLEKSKLIAETNLDFITWIEEQKIVTGVVIKTVFMANFTSLYPDFLAGKYKLTQTKFTQWLNKWCTYRDVKCNSRHQSDGIMMYNLNVDAKNDKEIFSKVLFNDEIPF